MIGIASERRRLGQFLLERLARHAVDGRERLIEQQYFRIARERAGKRDTLALAARELVGLARLEAVEVHTLQQRCCLRRALGLGDVVHGEPHVVERREMRKERIILEHEPDGARLRRHHDTEGAVEPDVGARNNAAGGRPVEARDGAQNRRLARARRADKREQLARTAGDVHVERNRPRLRQRDA